MMGMFKVTWIAILLFSLSCGNDPKGKVSAGSSGEEVTNNDMSADDGNESDDEMNSTMSSEDAPVILELSASRTTFTEGDFARINAVVTDPQGVQDILAGRLLDADTQQLVGTFAAISLGAFEVVVNWAELDAMRPITFGPSSSATRVLTAEFIDNANERSTRSLSFTLTCNGLPACEGRCGLAECNGECLSLSDEEYVCANNDDDPQEQCEYHCEEALSQNCRTLDLGQGSCAADCELANSIVEKSGCEQERDAAWECEAAKDNICDVACIPEIQTANVCLNAYCNQNPTDGDCEKL